MSDPRAGQPATSADLVDVAKLVTAYFTVHPDPEDPGQAALGVAQTEQVLKLVAAGEPVADIEASFRVGRDTVYRVLRAAQHDTAEAV